MLLTTLSPLKKHWLRIEPLEARQLLSAYVVVNVNDAGAGSLRQAILDANGHAGADTIGFAVPGAGLHTIRPSTPLPASTGPIVVDGYTQPGSSRNTIGPGANPNFVFNVQLDGTNLVGYDRSAGLEIAGGSSTVRGLNIVNFRGTEMRLSGAGGDVVEGNSIAGNLVVQGGPDNNTIGGLTPAARNVVGVVGINTNGNVVVGNITNGIGVTGSGNTIGGTTAAARNVASGNQKYGVQISGTNNVVLGNYIGTDVTGTQAVRNRTAGVFITGTNNTIGGTAPGAANIISGNSRGVYIFGGSNNTVQGNLIGVDANGHVLGNGLEGVQITSNGANNLIGGTTPAARNFLTGNRTGVTLFLGATGNQIQGNSIGVLPSGAAAGNDFAGVYISSTAINNAIGGTATGAGNIIANSTGLAGAGTGDGVFIESLEGASAPTGNAILGNSIFANAGLGIDLMPNGVNANDTGDNDTGSNNRQNYPVLSSAAATANTATIAGTLNSRANTTYRIEFFASPTGDPSGFGEGSRFVGATTVTTNGSGNASFSSSLNVSIAAGQVITATATDPGGNTSEFSHTRLVAAASSAVASSLAIQSAPAANTNTSRESTATVASPVTNSSTAGSNTSCDASAQPKHALVDAAVRQCRDWQEDATIGASLSEILVTARRWRPH